MHSCQSRLPHFQTLDSIHFVYGNDQNALPATLVVVLCSAWRLYDWAWSPRYRSVTTLSRSRRGQRLFDQVWRASRSCWHSQASSSEPKRTCRRPRDFVLSSRMAWRYDRMSHAAHNQTCIAGCGALFSSCTSRMTETLRCCRVSQPRPEFKAETSPISPISLWTTSVSYHSLLQARFTTASRGVKRGNKMDSLRV